MSAGGLPGKNRVLMSEWLARPWVRFVALTIYYLGILGGVGRALRCGGLLHPPFHIPEFLGTISWKSSSASITGAGRRRITPRTSAGVEPSAMENCATSPTALAAHLAASLPEKAPVVVLGHKEPELLIAYLGVIKSGRAYVPVDTAVPAQRIERIAAASGAALVLTPEKVVELSSGREPAPPWRLEPDDHYYIMFTSGSTGEPKGVPITYGCLQSFLQWILAEHPFD